MTSASVNVRSLEYQAMEPADYEALARLMLAAWGTAATGANVARRMASLRVRVGSATENRETMFVARDADEPIGFCRVYPDPSAPGAWWLAGLVVHPALRRRGVGSALVRVAAEHARRHGAERVKSETHYDNGPSIGFHRAFGFCDDGPSTAPDGDRVVAFHLDVGRAV